MHAWQFHNTHEPLTYDEKPIPEPGAGEVLIQVKAAGICHTDVGILNDDMWSTSVPFRPVALGHEIAGVITKVGEGVTDYKVGDKVAIWAQGEGHGFGRDGGFAEYITAGPAALVRVPDGVSWADAAAATDAGMTSAGAVLTNGQVKAGEKVGIIGFGGLGQIGAKLVVLNGAELYVAEVNEGAWDAAKEVGAKKVVKDITELADEQLDAIIDFAGFGTTTAGAVNVVRPGGRVIQVGLGKLESTISTYALTLKQVMLKGSAGGTKDDITEVLKWMAEGKIAPHIEVIKPAEIAEGIERLHDGKVRGRLVAVYDED